ncbi:OLC1v1002920C1 [Oldenlandia corymbosa var. corymbosa]|uniref:OLC1v1002920C1 n=1 Tax=Oldenlandia corymbosa var. corymbosa TaxID=529605 RepID=A0AAV1DA44_OLDCO|nr:OLC1v1002920C1 [Oldenlandia corymbosa var. corymbosa]
MGKKKGKKTMSKKMMDPAQELQQPGTTYTDPEEVDFMPAVEQDFQKLGIATDPEEFWHLPKEVRWKYIRLLFGSERTRSIESRPSAELREFFSFYAKSLFMDDCPDHQFEGAWTLANIVSGPSEYVELAVDLGAVTCLKRLLSSPSDDVRELAVLALGNIAGDSDIHRDAVLREEALDPLLKQLHEHARLSMLRVLSFTLFNIFRGKPQINVPPAFQALNILVFSEDTHPMLDVQIPALCTVRKIARGDDSQRKGLLPCLWTLLVSDNETIQREACRTISDIVTAGNEDQNQALIRAGFIEPLIYVLTADSDGLRKVAGQTVLDVISGGCRFRNKVKGLEGFIKPLSDLLMSEESVIVEFCLDGLALLCQPSDEEKRPGAYNFFARLIDEALGFDRIDHLQKKSNDENIREKASKIWLPMYAEALKLYIYFEEMADLCF